MIRRELLEALKNRLAVVADHEFRDRDPAAHLEALKAAAARLDVVSSRLPGNANPQLRHFIERQSFTKAIAWLEDGNPL